MNPRVTLIVVAVFALLLGYVFLVEANRTPEQLGTPAPTPQPAVFGINPSNVKTVEIRDLRMVREVQLSRKENGWQITKPENTAADTANVDSALGQLAKLQATRVLTNVSDLKPYGLANASVELRVIMTDTTAYALTVGDKTSDGSSYYAAYTGDKSKVFIISSFSLDALIQWLNSLPYQPTPTPTATATPPVTPTAESTPEATSSPGGTAVSTPTP